MAKKTVIPLLLVMLFAATVMADTDVEKAYDPFPNSYLFGYHNPSGPPPEHPEFEQYGYAYAPSTVYMNGTFHQFYCSTGGVSEDNYYHEDLSSFHHSWDHIRYRTSKNGYNWSAPMVALSNTKNYDSGQNERCTCDPSVVRGGDGYWYMLYDGNLKNYATVVYLARSEAIQGPYYKYTKRGTWERYPNDPKPIFKYKRSNTYYKLIPETNTYNYNNMFTMVGGKEYEVYGVGQQAVVYKDGYFHVWVNDLNVYTDDNVNIYTKIRYAKTTNLTTLSTQSFTSLSVVRLDGIYKLPGIGIGDVKWNPASNKFEMWTIIPEPTNCDEYDDNGYCIRNNSFIFVKYTSTDGKNWTKDNNFSLGPYRYIHNPGVSGNEYGYIQNNRYLLSFSAPETGVETDCYGTDCKLNVAIGVWPMYQKYIGGSSTSYTVKISNGAQLDVAPTDAEYYASDFDGDGVTDIGVLDKSNGNWYTVYSRKANGYKGATLKTTKKSFEDYTNDHKIIIGDFDGDGRADRGMYKIVCTNGNCNGSWYIYSSATNGGQGIYLVSNDVNGLGNIGPGWTWPGMGESFVVPSGDYDGDGFTDRVIVNPAYGSWYMLSSRYHDFMYNYTTDPIVESYFGWIWPGMSSAHEVVVGDFDGDRMTDKAIVNKEYGLWYVIPSRSQNAEKYINYFMESYYPNQHLFGFHQDNLNSNSIIAIGDYDGDGLDDLAFVNKAQGRLYVRNSSTGAEKSYYMSQLKSASQVKILPGDYDGDGVTEFAFVNTSTRRIYVYSPKRKQYGINTTIQSINPTNYSSSLAKKIYPETKEEAKDPIAPINFNISVAGKNLSITNLIGNEHVTILNILGKKIYESSSHNSNILVTIPTFGKYIVKVNSKTQIITIR